MGGHRWSKIMKNMRNRRISMSTCGLKKSRRKIPSRKSFRAFWKICPYMVHIGTNPGLQNSGTSLKLQFLTVSHFSTWFSERSGSGFENVFPPSKILKNKWVVQKSLMEPKKWIFHHISRWLSTNLVIFNFWFFSPIFENPVYKGILCKRDLQKSKKKQSQKIKMCSKNNFSINSEYHQESISEVR